MELVEMDLKPSNITADMLERMRKDKLDLFTLDGKQYLVVVDHNSDYFELESLRNVAGSTVIRAMKRNFVCHGIPYTCISDNGPQFDCHEFSRFVRDYRLP